MSIEYLVIAASGIRSADFTSQDHQSNDGERGLILTADVTDVTAGAFIVKIQGKDRVSGRYFDILSSTPFIGQGTRQLRVYPGLVASNNLTVNDVLPETWRVITVTASGTATFSLGASLLD